MCNIPANSFTNTEILIKLSGNKSVNRINENFFIFNNQSLETRKQEVSPTKIKRKLILADTKYCM